MDSGLDRPTYLEQSTLGLMGTPTVTPHLPGMLAALPMLTPPPPPSLLVMLLRQAQAAWRSAVDVARLLSERTPLQHAAEGDDAVPIAYPRHGATDEVTSPQLTAADAVLDATSSARTATAATRARRGAAIAGAGQSTGPGELLVCGQ